MKAMFLELPDNTELPFKTELASAGRIAFTASRFFLAARAAIGTLESFSSCFTQSLMEPVRQPAYLRSLQDTRTERRFIAGGLQIMSSSGKRSIHTQPQLVPSFLSTHSALWAARFVFVGFRAAVVTMLLLAASSSMWAQSADRPVVPDKAAGAKPDLSAYIARDLDPGEQSVMRAMLDTLPLSQQQDIASSPSDSVHIAIVDGGTGIIHYNRSEDVGSYEFQPSRPMPGQAPPYSLDSGIDPGLYAGSGPYRRVYTKPMPALEEPAPTEANDLIHQHFYTAIGDVSIACKMGQFAPDDVGYSYMGGWSGTWDTLSGAMAEGRAIDAGLQYSEKNDNYALIMAIAGLGIITQSNYSGTSTPPRIGCTTKNDWAEVRFSAFGAFQTPSYAPTCWKADDAQHRLDFIGFPSEGCNTYGLSLSVSSSHFVGHPGAIVTYKLIWYSPNYSYGGWGTLEPLKVGYYNGQKNVSGWLPRVPCENCAFKWMTSIAQKKENLTDKSWYAAAWSSHYIYKDGMGGTSTPIPTDELYCSEYPLWESAYPSKHAQDCRNSPAGLKGVQQSVSVTKFSPQFEVDLIDLKY
jgi:hypothetical protein